MRPTALTRRSLLLSATVLVLSLAVSSSAEARGGDWADRKARRARRLWSQTNQPPKPKEGDD